MSALPVQREISDVPVASAEYPIFEQAYSLDSFSTGTFMSPHYDSFPAFNGTTSMPSSAAHSTTSSNLASPISRFIPLGQDDLIMTGQQYQPPSDLLQGLQFTTLPDIARQQQYQNQQQQQPTFLQRHHRQQQRQAPEPMISGSRSDQVDIEMTNALSESFGNTMHSSSGASLASNYTDGVSASSTGFPEGSVFSNSGLVPDSSFAETEDMSDFVDFTGGQDPILTQASFFEGSSFPVEQHSSPAFPAPPTTQPLSNVPIIMTVIPSEGPMAGGTTVAIIGDHFSPELIVLFGGRTAKLQRISSTVIQCLSPPASFAGTVEVSIHRVPTSPPVSRTRNYFRYNMLDSDMWVVCPAQEASLMFCRMRLALQVREEYQGSSSDAAYRLAQHVARRSHSTNDWSERSNSSPSNSNTSAHELDVSKNDSSLPYKGDSLPAATRETHQRHDFPAVKASRDEATGDLETTILAFVASIDRNAPGSLRRSGAINCRSGAQQTMLHLATFMGFPRLLSRLVLIGAHLDLQDLNGYTALSLASLRGEVDCARILIDAGASYDPPTVFGEMPLDLAKAGNHPAIESLLLSAVWSTIPDHPSDTASAEATMMAGSKIDDGNPSSGSDDEISYVVRDLRTRKARVSQKAKPTALSPSPRRRNHQSCSNALQPTPSVPPISLDDDPPPYVRRDDTASWMSRTLLHIPHPPDILPGVAWGRLKGAAIFAPEKSGDHGWIQFSASTWDRLQKITSAEDVKLFTQAMATAVLNAVVQSGSTTTSTPQRPTRSLSKDTDQSASSRSAQRIHDSDNESPGRKIVRHVQSESSRLI